MIDNNTKQEALHLNITEQEIKNCKNKRSELLRLIGIRKKYYALADEAQKRGVPITHCTLYDSYCIKKSIQNFEKDFSTITHFIEPKNKFTLI